MMCRLLQQSVATVLLDMLLMFKVTALLWKGDEVREDHAAEAKMIERLDGVSLNVFDMVIIQRSLCRCFQVAHC